MAVDLHKPLLLESKVDNLAVAVEEFSGLSPVVTCANYLQSAKLSFCNVQ